MKQKARGTWLYFWEKFEISDSAGRCAKYGGSAVVVVANRGYKSLSRSAYFFTPREAVSEAASRSDLSTACFASHDRGVASTAARLRPQLIMNPKKHKAERRREKEGNMPVSKPLILEVPEECLPPLTDELRWKALRRHIKDYSPMYDPPPEGVVAFPPMAVPPSDCYNYAKGQYSKITPAFLFFRKALLILVGGQDILKSVVEKGQCTGADVRDQWHVVLDRTLQEAQNRVASEQERVLIQVLRDDLKQGRSREVRIGLISYSLRLAAFSSLSI